MSQSAVAMPFDDMIAELDASTLNTVQRLSKLSPYEVPEVSSFPMDSAPETAPLARAGNSY